MKRLLVTGGAGFIGSNFVRHWLEHHPSDRVIVLDALTYAGNLGSLADVSRHESLEFVHGDICDSTLVREMLDAHGINTIVHFAAESHVDRSIEAPDAFVRTNVNGTLSLLNAAQDAWKSRSDEPVRFHHVSTDEVYGSLGPDDPAFTESSSYEPNSPYAASKAASDHLCRAYAHTYGLPVSISNCSNNYGPYHFPEKLIPLIVVNLLEGKSLPVYGDGSNVRDWLHVSDHCLAIDHILQGDCAGETFNVGGNAERRNLDVVQTLCRLVDERFAGDAGLAGRFPGALPAKGRSSADSIRFVTDRPGHDWRYAIDATKLRERLGFAPRVTFEQGLDATLSWMIDNEQWWRAVMDGSYRDWVALNYSSARMEAESH